MSPEQNDEYRREVIRRLEDQDRELEAKAKKAEAEAAQARQQRSELEVALRRAQLPFPPGDPCPLCWIMHGRDSQLYPVPHEEPEKYDRMKCGSEGCNYVEDREA